MGIIPALLYIGDINMKPNNDKSDIWDGLGTFFSFLGLALCLFVIGWCTADFPGLHCNDNQKTQITEKTK